MEDLQILVHTAPFRAWILLVSLFLFVLLSVIYILSIWMIKPIASLVAHLERERAYSGHVDGKHPDRIHSRVTYRVHMLIAHRHEPDTLEWVRNVQNIIKTPSKSKGKKTFSTMQRKLLARTMGKATEKLLQSMDNREDRIKLVSDIRLSAKKLVRRTMDTSNHEMAINLGQQLRLSNTCSTLASLDGHGFDAEVDFVLVGRKACAFVMANENQIVFDVPASVTESLNEGQKVCITICRNGLSVIADLDVIQIEQDPPESYIQSDEDSLARTHGTMIEGLVYCLRYAQTNHKATMRRILEERDALAPERIEVRLIRVTKLDTDTD